MRTTLCLAALGAIASLLVAQPARATVTAITVNTAGVTWQNPDGTYYPNRIVNGTSEGIGFADCAANATIFFPLTVTGLPDTSVSFQVWAGTGDCTQAGATNNASTGICWPVAASVTAQPVMSFGIRTQDIVSGLGVSPPPQVYQVANTSICTSAANSTTTVVTDDDSGTTSTTSGTATVNIYFMFFPVGNSTPTVTATPYPILIKLLGPAACTGVSAGSGDGLLIVNWTPPVGETDIQGYYLYSAPVGSSLTGDSATDATTVTTVCPDSGQQGTELLDDAGNPVLDDAGNPIFVDDAGVTITQSDAGCYNQYNLPTQNDCVNGTGTLPISATTVCGDAGVTSDGISCATVSGTTNSTGNISGLSNGTSYNVAVAAFDEFGNTGSPSNVVCATPAPIDDFWKTYNADGGSAYCALDVVGGHGAPIAGALVVVAGGVLVRRRRKQRRG